MLYIGTHDDFDLEIYTNTTLQKGQLYNVDLDEYIGFQFNPTAFEWTRETIWGVTNWVGNTRGGDRQFINNNPRRIELELLFIADPRSPQPDYRSQNRIVGTDGLVDFQAIRDTIDRWSELIEGLERPSRVGIMIGPNAFEGVIINTTFRITEFFEDLSAKEGLLLIEFEEWQPL